MKKESEFILWFSDINMESLPQVGGKAASLGEMFNMKLPIPNGFCITAEGYQYFLDETNIKNKIAKLLENLDVENTDVLEETAKKIQELIVKQEIPIRIKNSILESYELMNVSPDLLDTNGTALSFIKAGRDLPYVAVRSSATAEDLPQASFAGQQETFLNVKGNKNLLESIKKCWASLFTARAIYYRTKNNFDHMKVYLCVIVHKMINGDVSGVMFTANPTNNDESEIMIEASYGVGETIVSGSVNPDNYMVDKSSLEIKSIKVHKKDFMITRDDNSGSNKKVKLDDEKANSQCLNERRIRELAEYGKKIESHYRKPMDIEWGIERNKLYILQARPITTLKKEHKKTDELKGEVILEGLNASPGIASGVVRLVKDISEITKIQEGDILVTRMTDPDYVVAMKKASAIVTDEGGITAHAAIVSRELGIPCVVGTEKATQLLKENEIITVDGTHGIVYKGALVQ